MAQEWKRQIRNKIKTVNQLEVEIDHTPIAFQGILGDLVSAIGIADALRLVKRLGGSKHYVPTVPRVDHPLTMAIGVPACNRLCAHFARKQIEIPSLNAFPSHRDQAINDALDQGGDMNILAVQFGLSRRRIRMIRTESEALADF